MKSARKDLKATMIKKNYKGRCTKRTIQKSENVVRLYSELQDKYVDVLEQNPDIKEINCNVLLDGLDIGAYTSDFVCTKESGDIMVRECVMRKHLTKPMTVRLLDASKEYWERRGVMDWGIVVGGDEK